jgi:hypothetical protein
VEAGKKHVSTESSAAHEGPYAIGQRANASLISNMHDVITVAHLRWFFMRSVMLIAILVLAVVLVAIPLFCRRSRIIKPVLAESSRILIGAATRI